MLCWSVAGAGQEQASLQVLDLEARDHCTSSREGSNGLRGKHKEAPSNAKEKKKPSGGCLISKGSFFVQQLQNLVNADQRCCLRVKFWNET